MLAATRLLTSNVTIFSEHEVFADSRHSNKHFLFFLLILQKCESNGKNSNFNPGFINIFFNLSFLRSRHTMQFSKFVIIYSNMY